MSDAIKTPLEMFYHWESTAADQVFLRQPKQLEWTEYTWADVADRARRIASFINSKNLEAGSRIAMLSSNSADWIIVDLAIMLSGNVSVPLYPGQDIPSARYILEHSEASMIFVGNFDLAAKASEMLPADMERVAMLGCSIDTATSLDDIITRFEPYNENPVPALDALMTILYTSGTTGNPKGVMHSHGTPGRVAPRLMANMSRNLKEDRGRFFSFLPLSHAAERIAVEMNALYTNPTISFSESLETFPHELRAVKPTLFFAVPRLWIKFKAGIDAQFSAEQQAAFGEPEKSFIREVLGLDKATFILTGSAPCPKDIQQWYIDMGIMVRDGYGMTENFIDGCVWHMDETPIPGCVGKPLDGVELKLTEEEEICFRSGGVMSGYYKEPAKTAEVLQDGWYHTGDSGRIDEEGNLWVTGRISEVFKTTKGKFIKPSRIEGQFGAINDLEQFCVFGHGMDQPVVAVTLSEVGQAKEHGELKQQLEEQLEAINADLPPYERIARLMVCADEWTIDNGLLTPTLKVKRKAIEVAYREWIERDTDAGHVIFQ